MPTGPYRVGIKAFDIFDSSRKTFEWPDGRLVPIHVYFPLDRGAHKTFPKVLETRAYDVCGSLDIWQALDIKVYGEHRADALPLKDTSLL